MPEWATRLFGRIAVPRLTGTAALQAVRAALVEHLITRGFKVEQLRFVTSARRLTAATVASAGVVWMALGLTPLLILPFPGWAVGATAAGGAVLVALAAFGVAEGFVPLGPPSVDAVLIQAVRDRPTLWLVAHADTKAQATSLLTRVVAALAAAVGVGGLAVLLVVRVWVPLSWPVVIPVVALCVLGGVFLARGGATDGSPGAVDNASGVIAALVAAEALADQPDVGVLITDAEELGMEGARAWVRTDLASGRFVNFDGIDSRGAFRVMRHRAGPPVSRNVAEALSVAVVGAFRAEGRRAIERALPPGVLVDGVVLASAGLAGITVSRGNLATLAIVHTPRDQPARVDVEAAVAAGRAVARAVRQLAS